MALNAVMHMNKRKIQIYASAPNVLWLLELVEVMKTFWAFVRIEITLVNFLNLTFVLLFY